MSKQSGSAKSVKKSIITDYENYPETDTLINIAGNLDCYEFVPYKKDDEGYDEPSKFSEGDADRAKAIQESGGVFCLYGIVCQGQKENVQKRA